MSSYCDKVQEALAEQGMRWLNEERRAQEHLIQCTGCFECLEALKTIDFELAQSRHDASDIVVSEVLAKISALPLLETTPEARTSEATNSNPLHRRRRIPKTVLALGTLGLLVAFSSRELTGELFKLIEGAVGALLFLGALAAAVIVLCLPGKQFRKRLFPAATFASAAVCVLVLRAMTSLFFGSDYVDYESSSTFSDVGSAIQSSPPSAAEPIAEPDAEISYADRSGSASKDEVQQGEGGGPSGSFSEAAYDDDLVRNSVGKVVQMAQNAVDGLTKSKSKQENRKQDQFQDPAARPEQFKKAGRANEMPARKALEHAGSYAKAQKPAAPGVAAQESYADLIVASRSDIASGNKERKEMYDMLDRAPRDEKNSPVPPATVARERAQVEELAERRAYTNDNRQVPKEYPVLAEPSAESEAGADSPADAEESKLLAGLESQVASSNRLGQVTFEKGKRQKGGSVAGVTSATTLEPMGDRSMMLAQEYLKNRANTEGLNPVEATGYWANTYLPGDTTMRVLHSVFLGADLSLLKSYIPEESLLHEGAAQPAQPFDAPESSGLAVYLHTDQTGIQQAGRMLVQVGLKGSSRRSGNRQAMNVAVVLDLRNSPTAATKAQLKELIFALNQAKDLGDHFSLLVAGYPSATAIKPEDFKHGPLTVLLGDVLEKASPPAEGRTLLDTMQDAVALVSNADDPTAPLGSSAVLLLTAQDIGPELPAIRILAHQSAVAGIPLSVIGLDGAKQAELEELALSGQGNRRLFTAGTDPRQLVDRELTAVSNIVARAVRLRIRLAPGVKLIQVIGSKRLDELRAEEVRQAEQSVDRRLARNLGIEADRGEDEEGIQIVIPSFHSDDAHVVLLDVIAPGPGPIADVTVRYKDLVHLKNGIARANLSLGRAQKPAGTLELNVLKNLLAFELAQALDTAGSRFAAGFRMQAKAVLEARAELLKGLKAAVPGFERDVELERDYQMLEQYVALLDSPALQDAEQRELLLRSMEYAGKLKQNAKPAEE